jgi:hypothetical protein
VKDTPPLPCKNYFNVLAVEEIEIDSSATTDVSPVPETAQTEKMRKSKLEKKLPKKLNIGAAGIPSTFGWKLKAQTISGSMQSML